MSCTHDKKEPNVEFQSRAIAAITTHMANDKVFAEKLIETTERGNHNEVHALVNKVVSLEPSEVVILPNGICICRGSFCVCVVIRKQ
jgi:hypothetical protein